MRIKRVHSNQEFMALVKEELAKIQGHDRRSAEWVAVPGIMDTEAAAHDQSKSPHKPGSSMWCRGCITEGRTPASIAEAQISGQESEIPGQLSLF